MKKYKMIIIIAFIVPIIGAFKSKRDSEFLPMAWYKNTSNNTCNQIERPAQCAGGTAFCNYMGFFVYSDNVCGTQEFFRP